MMKDTDVTPWVDPLDLLDRKKYADFLTDYLASIGEPFVLNLNASWGMGKTYFLTHWRASIMDRYPTVYVDAWKNDFSDDPLLAVMSAIHNQLKQYLPTKQKSIEGFSKYLKSGGRFVKGVAPVVVKGLINKAVGKDATEELFELSTKELADVAEKSMSLLLDDHAQKEKSIEEFQESIGKLVDVVTKGEARRKPLFLFIDELDRCRPTYAVELLEAVKHLFSVPGVVFIVATDSEQLRHSVCAIYGEQFNGGEYLRRFFDQEYTLPEPDYLAYCKFIADDVEGSDHLVYYNFLPWSANGITENEMPEGWQSSDSLAAFLAIYSKHFSLPIRTIEQVVTRLKAILPSSNMKWDAPFLLFLLVLQGRHSGAIGELKELCNKNRVPNERVRLAELIGEGGGVMRWYNYSAWDEPKVVNHEHTVQLIGMEYLTLIGRYLSIAPKQRYSEFVSEHRQLKNVISNKLAGLCVAQNDMTDITKYFDYVEMAGTLS